LVFVDQSEDRGVDEGTVAEGIWSQEEAEKKGAHQVDALSQNKQSTPFTPSPLARIGIELTLCGRFERTRQFRLGVPSVQFP
jgi:hypothetical protein